MYSWLKIYTAVELQALRLTASASYQKLITGSSVREIVDQNGERVVFTSTSLTALTAYLEAIEAALAAKIAGVTQSRAPIRFVF